MLSKQDKILESALKLFVEYGFHGTPTSKIAEEAGVSNGILFHYFPTKESLIVELYVSTKGELIEFLQSQQTGVVSVESQIKNTLFHTIVWATQNKQKYYYIEQVHFSPHIFQIPVDIQEAYIKPHRDLIEQAKTEKSIKDIPTDMILALIHGHVGGMREYFLSKGTYSDIDVREGVELIWQSLSV